MSSELGVMPHKSIIVGVGSCLPKKIVSNEELSLKLETTDEWIKSRVGVNCRHIIEEDESIIAIATQACQKAMADAGVSALDIDAIVVATTSNPYIFPSMAVFIQHELGAKKAFAFDVQAVCSGFVYALSMADNFIKVGQAKTVLVVGAEAMSRLIDPMDRSTAVIFGDGAGAVILQRTSPTEERGILSTHLYSDGSLSDLLYVKGGPGSTVQKESIVMKGRDVFRHAVDKLGKAILAALDANQLKPSDIDWFIPHQANARIIEGLAEHFDLPMEKVIMTLGHHGNTSAASIPLALDEAVRAGKVKKGDLIIFEALGGGLTWGSAAVRW